jgi:predicted nucleotidyltransferase component of viral defense system
LESIYLASREDIAAMKIIAISQRGKRRDFFDIYFLIREFGVKKIIEFTKEKYPIRLTFPVLLLTFLSTLASNMMFEKL